MLCCVLCVVCYVLCVVCCVLCVVLCVCACVCGVCACVCGVCVVCVCVWCVCVCVWCVWCVCVCGVCVCVRACAVCVCVLCVVCECSLRCVLFRSVLGQFLKHECVSVVLVRQKLMSSCGAGGQFVISVHRLLTSQRFGRDSRFMLNKIFGALAGGSNLHIVVFLLGGFTCGLFCGAGLVLCFWATFTILDGGRSPATAEAVSVCVGHGQNDSSGVRRGSRVLSWTAAMLNTTGRMCDSPNSLFWILIPEGDVYPELLRVPPATDDNDACWSPLGAGLRIRSSQAHFALSRSHRASGSRSSRDGGHVHGG